MSLISSKSLNQFSEFSAEQFGALMIIFARFSFRFIKSVPYTKFALSNAVFYKPQTALKLHLWRFFSEENKNEIFWSTFYLIIKLVLTTDYGHPERKWPSLHGRKFNPNPKFIGRSIFCLAHRPNFCPKLSLVWSLV